MVEASLPQGNLPREPYSRRRSQESADSSSPGISTHANLARRIDGAHWWFICDKSLNTLGPHSSVQAQERPSL